jgi:hypothetical protein
MSVEAENDSAYDNKEVGVVEIPGMVFNEDGRWV